jgi:hypothetical protein
MNWHYDEPIVNQQYLCCVKGYGSPISLYWNKELGGWGEWWNGEYGDELEHWNQFDNSLVVCYIDYNEIPMPENWEA